MKIPKIIHYCWFGPNDKPQDVLDYVEGWKRILPEYRIMEWNEENFDINCNQYVKEAYEAKKFAFVSDYARLCALYNHGGIYLDTDVEVFKVFDDLLDNDVVLGFEEKNFIATSTLCAKKQSAFIEAFKSLYDNRQFVKPNGELDLTTNVTEITTLLAKFHVKTDGKQQTLKVNDDENILILDRRKFSPYDYLNQIDHSDKTSYAMHHFGATWASSTFKYKKLLKSIIIKLVGSKNYKKLSDRRN